MLLITTSGCKKKGSCVPPEPETEVEIRVAAADNTNGGLPTLVKVFVLKSDFAFARASYNELQEDHETVLADDFLDGETLTVHPESEVSLVVSRDESARFLGVTAFYRNPVGERWKETIHLLKPSQCPLEGGEQPEWGGSMYQIDLSREQVSGSGVVKRKRADSATKKKPKRLKIPSKAPTAPTIPSAPKGPAAPNMPKVGALLNRSDRHGPAHNTSQL